LQELRDQRNGHAKHEVLDEASSSKDHQFYSLVKNVEVDQDEVDSKKHSADTSFVKKLFLLSDESGKLTFTEVASGSAVKRSQLTEKDVFILDTGKGVFVYTGNEASAAERANAIIYAHNYLSKSEHPFLSITAVKHGQKCAEFEAAF
jgi:gelsolin